MDFISVGGLDDVILVGHSYGGIVITGVADRLDSRLRRLVYLSAFVANNGESLSDLVPPHYPALLTALGDGSVVLPFQIWRDAYINDADLETAQRAYRSVEPAAAQDIYRQDCAAQESGRDDTAEVLLNCTEDTALPHSFPLHPRLSERLGLFRLVQTPGSHELCFSNPARLVQAILEGGRD